MSRISAFCEWLLRRPLVWGGMACFAFYVIAVQNLDHDSALYRCFAGTAPGAKALVSVLFFTAGAALVIKLLNIVVQFGALERIGVVQDAGEGSLTDKVDGLLRELSDAPQSLHEGYQFRRLRNALQFIKQHDSADGLDGELHRLAETDRQRMASSFASTRAIAAAIGVLGVLGALRGASDAIAAIAATSPQASAAAAGGAQLALDCLSQALALTLALLLAKFAAERVELRLLAAVDDSVRRRLGGPVVHQASPHDPEAGSLKRMCERLLATVETAISRHDSSLVKAMGASARRWDEAATATSTLIHRSMGEALTSGLNIHAQNLNEGVTKHAADLGGVLVRHAEILSENINEHTSALVEALEHHTAVMTETEKTLADENRRHLSEVEAALGESMLVAATRQEKLIEQSEELLKEMQAALVEAAGTTVAQQELLIRQGDVLLKVVEATGQVRRLEEALNSNLSALASAHHFEETVVSLSAALQLLSANLGRPNLRREDLGLDSEQRKSQAA